MLGLNFATLAFFAVALTGTVTASADQPRKCFQQLSAKGMHCYKGIQNDSGGSYFAWVLNCVSAGKECDDANNRAVAVESALKHLGTTYYFNQCGCTYKRNHGLNCVVAGSKTICNDVGENCMDNPSCK
ncbi:hypothetical protein K7432_016881 [Basidiobolus ranarum]|uniref:Uncharacterized protein n=1 Tax=Basidiobolus ranarum TaxID=34480 RepID=A0ABR2WE43_9FUNG